MTRTYSTAHTADDRAVEVLMQIVDIDGDDSALLRDIPVLNGSGKTIGTEFTVSDETAQFIDEALAQQADLAGGSK